VSACESRRTKCRCEFCFSSGPEEEERRERERESPLVRLSRHFSVNEPRVAGEPSWSTRAARRDPHYSSRDLTPHCSRGGDHVRSVHVLSLPDAILHDAAHLRLPSILSPPSPPLHNPFHLRDSPPTRSLNSSRSPLSPSLTLSLSLFLVSVHPPDAPLAFLPPSPPSTTSRSLSLSSPLVPPLVPSHPSRIAQCRNMYDGTPVLLTSQVSALG